MTTFFGILTKVGEAKEANAKALGVPVLITELEVGDGGGVSPIPNREQSALIGSKRRAPINRSFVDPNNPSWLVIEQVIPEQAGGWWIRELGLRDADGDLVAVANCPPTYKPQLAEGSARTQVVRMVIQVSSASDFELKIDPSVVLATRDYVDAGLSKKRDKNDVLPIANGGTGRSGFPPFVYMKTDSTGGSFHLLTPEQVYHDIGAAERLANELALRDQDIAALKARTGRLLNVQVFTTSGIYVPTPGTKLREVMQIGGGGAGGGAAATVAGVASVGLGGSAGAFAHYLIVVEPSNTPVVIGAGGTGVTGQPGGNGGATSFGSFCICPGGAGGAIFGPTSGPNIFSTQFNNSSPAIIDAIPIVSAAGALTQSSAFILSPTNIYSGQGANTIWGAGGGGQGTGVGGNGSDSGTGGGGSANVQGNPARPGGNGGPGRIIVREYA